MSATSNIETLKYFETSGAPDFSDTGPIRQSDVFGTHTKIKTVSIILSVPFTLAKTDFKKKSFSFSAKPGT